ncbi:hypothetical protein BDN72DRAFT_959213 [Pluteus cervinus]|uniref:Uncharacterized protein n=1 Tax=Pluteus cervinus TaxID=181527 RepID=A0ACD3AW01_9AGAR|nr:hypothetical protein BDN72DRAFT_959213 [Pluteus cervinus]
MSNSSTDASYPLGPPKTAFERVIHSLDQENFEADRYAYIDALLTFSLMATKRRPGGGRAGRALVLDNALKDPQALNLAITKQEGISLCDFCRASISREQPTRERCYETALEVQEMFPNLFEETDVDIMTHVLLRYLLLHSEESSICLRKIRKTTDDGVRIFGAGLKAIKQIPASIYILTAGGSMSSNEVESGGKFVIRSQPGATDKKLILGPIRFVNHDCKPNCQIQYTPDSQACTLRTLREIQPDEMLTISYEADGYFEPPKAAGGECNCASCCPRIPKPDNPGQLSASADTGKKRRRRPRGGRRAKKRKLEDGKCKEDDELEEGEVRSEEEQDGAH